MATRLLKRLRRSSKAISPQLSPTEKLTQTYELLEHILGYLDAASLRQAQLVSSHWHDLIHKSSSLGRRLKESKAHILRTTLIGSPSAGIPSLVRCLFQGPPPYVDSEHASYSSDFLDKALTVDDEAWRIDGVSSYLYDSRPSMDPYLGHTLANCDTVILVYSTTHRDSFDRLKAWVAHMNSPTEPLSLFLTIGSAKGRSSARLEKRMSTAVVATESHVPNSERAVQSSEGAEFARKLDCPFIEASAQTGDSVKEAFAEICQKYKRAKMADISFRSRRSSFLRTLAAASLVSNGQKEKWWQWQNKRQSHTAPA